MKTTKLKFAKKNGNIIIFTVFFIPLLLILSGLVIDGGFIFLRKAQLQSIADNASSAGISVIADEIIDIINQKVIDDPEFIPPADITTALNDTDRAQIAASTEPTDMADTYLTLNNDKNITLIDQSVIYPYNYSPSDSQISLYISIANEHTLYFAPMLGIETQKITSEAISSMKIR